MRSYRTALRTVLVTHIFGWRTHTCHNDPHWLQSLRTVLCYKCKLLAGESALCTCFTCRYSDHWLLLKSSLYKLNNYLVVLIWTIIPENKCKQIIDTLIGRKTSWSTTSCSAGTFDKPYLLFRIEMVPKRLNRLLLAKSILSNTWESSSLREERLTFFSE